MWRDGSWVYPAIPVLYIGGAVFYNEQKKEKESAT